MKYVTYFALLIVVLLSGCNSSNSSKEPDPVAIEPPEVHSIQPEDVPAYIETFKQQQLQVKLEFDGRLFDLDVELASFDFENNLVYITYDLGLLVFGFDLNEEEPIASLNLFEGDITNFDLANFEPTRALPGSGITLSEDSNENITYSGQVASTDGQATYNVRLVINQSLFSGGTSQLSIQGESAILSGDLGTRTYIQIDEMLMNNPEVKRIVIQNVSGSINDAINMHTGRLVRNAKLTTVVPADGSAASGGVDLFASGEQRIYEAGGKIGVHSWCCVDGKTAGELGKDHSGHGAQLTYFREMLGVENGPEFYFFTIDAAPFDGLHQMTVSEMKKYQLTTE